MENKKKKILLFTVQFYPESTGYSFATTNFVKAISEQYDVTVMTPVSLPVDKKELEYVIVKRGNKNGLQKYLYQFRILFTVIRNLKKFDAIFFDTAEMFLLGNIISKIAPNKTILRLHGCMTTEAAYFSKTIMMRIWKLFITKLVKNTKIITSTTHHYINFVKKLYLKFNLYDIGNKNFGIIPNTIFPGDYQLPNKSEIFEKYQIESSKFNMLTLGRMDKDGLVQKGIEDLLFALKMIKKYSKNDFTLTIIGKGKKKQYLINLAKSLEIENHVRFVTFAPHLDILALSKYLDATVLYSRFEGMSMFALESICFGCFPIFSDVGGLKDLVRDNYSGFLVEPQNIPKLTKKIIQRIEMKEKDSDIFRNNSIKHFKTNFSPEIVAEKFNEVMHFIIQSRNNI